MIEYRQLTSILALFLIVQLSGVLLIFALTPQLIPLISPGQVTSQTNINTSISPIVLYYFGIVILTALLMIFLIRTHRIAIVLRILEVIMIFGGTFYLLILVMSLFISGTSPYPTPVAIVLSAALVIAKNIWPRLRNFAAVVASIGIGTLFGLAFGLQFGFFSAYMLMAVFALYDYVAVFITKHMIAMGREAVNRNLAFMIGSYETEIMPKGYIKGKELTEMNKALSKTQNPTLKRLFQSGNIPIPAFSGLGNGDLIIPLMLAVCGYVTYFSYITSLVIVIGSCVGLVFAMYVGKKFAMAMPAIPPLFAFDSIALGIEFLLINPKGWLIYTSLFVLSIAILGLLWTTAKRQSMMGVGGKIIPNHA